MLSVREPKFSISYMIIMKQALREEEYLTEALRVSDCVLLLSLALRLSFWLHSLDVLVKRSLSPVQGGSESQVSINLMRNKNSEHSI